MQVRVLIKLKNGVLDPQGEAVRHALGGMGYDGVSAVRQGKVIDLEIAETDLETARTRVGEMCEKLLANTVIETYEIEIL